MDCEEDRARTLALREFLDRVQGVGRPGRAGERDAEAPAPAEAVAQMSGRVLQSLIEPKRAYRVSVDRIRELFEQKMTDEQIALALCCSENTIRIKRLANGMQRDQGPKGGPARKIKRRFKAHVVKGRRSRGVVLLPTHPASAEGRTLFPSRVVSVTGLLNVLVSGEHTRKIGDKVIKGEWSGMPIFTLTLEERATCPRSCLHWGTCYGNNSQYAKRIRNDADFEERLGHELAVLNYRYPAGFVVRLHQLGDFYSVEYVRLWATFLHRFAALRVFGYSARWNMKDDPIADELVRLIYSNLKRFCIRLSDAPIEEWSTASIKNESEAPADSIICPQQTGKTASCGTCALCWSSPKRVAFLQH